ncbi:MAG: hypothetical protein LBV72_12395 [Tannerella sp.]|jgi:hypothetical protein|nr:hypothetical protein [Tannerella sp.]
MGMCAELIAVGPYTKNIIDVLEYPKEMYINLNNGSIITVRLFGISEGSSLSREFAELLGISDAWDFNQHKIINEKINIEKLRKFVEVYKEYAEDLNKLIKLKDSGFEFHFRPEG